MSGILEPPVVVVETMPINRFEYGLSQLIPHTSVVYGINCYTDNVLVKTITGLLEGEQYIEWTTDEWMDRFIKSKIEALNLTVA
jgi:hypothetical protein